MAILAWILGSVFVVSLLSLVGVITLVFNPKLIKKSVLYLVSFAAGAMLATAFFDLIPEAMEKNGFDVLSWVLGGIVLFLVAETFLYWYHCHDETCKVHKKSHNKKHQHHTMPVAYLNLFGDAIHNFLDGVIIAGAFLASIPLGIVASVAVIFHEIPQEIGDFGVLIYSGFGRFQALFYNFLCALTAVLGALLTYFFATTVQGLSDMLLPIAAGGFIYIATADLLPEMHRQTDFRKVAISLLCFFAGIAIIWAVSNYLHIAH